MPSIPPTLSDAVLIRRIERHLEGLNCRLATVASGLYEVRDRRDGSLIVTFDRPEAFAKLNNISTALDGGGG